MKQKRLEEIIRQWSTNPTEIEFLKETVSKVVTTVSDEPLPEDLCAEIVEDIVDDPSLVHIEPIGGSAKGGFGVSSEAALIVLSAVSLSLTLKIADVILEQFISYGLEQAKRFVMRLFGREKGELSVVTKQEDGTVILNGAVGNDQSLFKSTSMR